MTIQKTRENFLEFFKNKGHIHFAQNLRQRRIRLGRKKLNIKNKK